MPITHAITHRLRSTTDSKAKLSLREDELERDGYVDDLLAKLKSSFLSRISREHGSFTQDEETGLLEHQLKAFLADEISFAQLSAAIMEHLRDGVEEQGVELDAHFLFYIEKSFDHHLFYLFGANLTESLTIDKDLEVMPSYAIDNGPSLFGIKVDLGEWQEHENYAYLSLLPPRGNQLFCDLFYDLTGFGNGVDKRGATLAFLQGVEAYTQQVPEEQVNDYRSQVVDYCMERDQQDAPVDFHGLAKAVDGIDGDAFAQVMAEHSPAAEQGVMMDRRSLRRYVKFAGRERDLAISFSSHQLNTRIKYDAERDLLTINGIPKALRNQLLGHLKGEQPS